jgi:drug/metabolite transporter (DMT)-like permease
MLAVMSVAVGLQVIGAVVLKTLADTATGTDRLALLAGIAGVGLLNLCRLAVWGYAHTRFPLSSSFPTSALFFPAMLLVAVAYGDPVGPQQVLGAGLITLGSTWLSLRRTP